jgi:hypothetical protein
MSFLALIGEVILLGLAAAITPGLFAMQVLIVAGDNWIKRSAAVLAGAGLGFGLVSLILFAGFTQLPAAGSGSAFEVIGELVIGIGLLVASVWLLLPHPAIQQRAEATINNYASKASSKIFFAIAFALAVKDVSSYAVMLPALHDIATAGLWWPIALLLLGVLYVLALTPVLVPPLARLIIGQPAVKVMQKVYRFVMDHQFRIVGVMFVVIGGALVAISVPRLSTVLSG